MAEMTPLRRRMIEDMQVRNLSPVTMMQRGSLRRAMANKKLTGLTLAATRERLADLDRTLLGALLLRR
jgi:hypothetical protein